MNTYFDILPHDVIIAVLYKIKNIKSLISLSKIHAFDRVMQLRSFWIMKYRNDFPLLKLDHMDLPSHVTSIIYNYDKLYKVYNLPVPRFF